MKAGSAWLLALFSANGHAATAYVTDQLVLGVYAEQSAQSKRLTTLHSGAAVETLTTSGEVTEVRLADGTTGWVKTSYLISSEPATVRLKLLQEELDRARATTPGLAEAAERSEVARLTRALAASRTDSAQPVPTLAGVNASHTNATGAGTAAAAHAWAWIAAIVAALGCGFWLGFATLARRIKQRFGGIKVY